MLVLVLCVCLLDSAWAVDKDKFKVHTKFECPLKPYRDVTKVAFALDSATTGLEHFSTL